jgi:hypothetical protein
MLQPQSQKILATLQPLVKTEMGWLLRLPYHEDGGELYPFVWDGSEQGEFNLWNLLQAEGWSQATNLETVLENWHLPERTGAVNGATWLLPDADEAGILLDEATRAARLEHYRALMDVLQENLSNLQAFQLSPRANHDEEKRDPEVYRTVIVVGQAADGWVGVMPNIPHATPERDFPFRTSPSPASADSSLASALEPQLQASLAQLAPIQVYGYYGGGYNQVHDHKLVYATGATQTAAIEQVLYRAGGAETTMFDGFQFDGFKPKINPDSEQRVQIESLDQFLRRTFSQLRLDRICFWNQERFYISGAISGEQTEDRVGVVVHSQFTYNP